MRPRLSIVVFSRDDADHLGRCLASLVTVEPEGGREVLVVDNASTDASLEVVEAASGDLPVSCIALEEETSFSRGNNLGLEEARGEQVLFLNPDTLPTQATIEACQRALDDDPGVGLVSPRLVYPDGSHQATGWHLPSPTQLLRERLGVSSREVPPSGSGSTDVGWLMGCFLMGRRDSLQDLGGFDEDFWFHGTDLELCARVGAAGRRVVRADEAELVHVGHRDWGQERRRSSQEALVAWLRRDHGPVSAQLVDAAARWVEAWRS